MSVLMWKGIVTSITQWVLAEEVPPTRALSLHGPEHIVLTFTTDCSGQLGNFRSLISSGMSILNPLRIFSSKVGPVFQQVPGGLARQGPKEGRRILRAN